MTTKKTKTYDQVVEKRRQRTAAARECFAAVWRSNAFHQVSQNFAQCLPLSSLSCESRYVPNKFESGRGDAKQMSLGLDPSPNHGSGVPILSPRVRACVCDRFIFPPLSPHAQNETCPCRR